MGSFSRNKLSRRCVVEGYSLYDRIGIIVILLHTIDGILWKCLLQFLNPPIKDSENLGHFCHFKEARINAEGGVILKEQIKSFTNIKDDNK